jgi:hypothetical protein
MKKTLLVCCALLAVSLVFGHALSVLNSMLGDQGTGSPPSPPTGCTETYCVDQAKGNDSNPGTAALPFKNLTAIPTLTAGQSVGLACESPPAHWRQWINQGAAPNNITITGYGPCTSTASIIAGATSNLPIIDGANIITTGWTKTSGYTNVYNTNSALNYATWYGGGQGGLYKGTDNSGPPYGAVNAFLNFWEDDGSTTTGGKFLSWQSSIAAVDANACSYYMPNLITTGANDNNLWAIPPSGTLYIHGCNPTALNPSTNGYTYDYSDRVYAIALGSAGCTIEYLEARKANWGAGEVTCTALNGKDTYSNLIIRDYSESGLGITGGSSVTNSVFIDGYFPVSTNYGGSPILIYENGAATGLNSSITNNIFQWNQNVSGNAAIYPVISQLTSGSEGSLTFSNNWIIGNNGTHTSYIEANTFTSVLLDSDYFINAHGVVLVGGSPTTVSNSVVYSSGCKAGCLGVFQVQSGNNLKLTNNNICETNTYYGIVRNNGAATITSSGNKFYLATPGGYAGVYSGDSGVLTVSSQNDDFGGSGTWYPVVNYAASGSTWTTPSSPANIYEGATHWEWNNASISTLVGWKAATGVSDPSSVTSGSSASGACSALGTIPNVQ